MWNINGHWKRPLLPSLTSPSCGQVTSILYIGCVAVTSPADDVIQEELLAPPLRLWLRKGPSINGKRLL